MRAAGSTRNRVAAVLALLAAGAAIAMLVGGGEAQAAASLRAEVVDALGEIGGQTAIRLLRQASTDPQSAVREEAADLLAELSGGTAPSASKPASSTS